MELAKNIIKSCELGYPVMFNEAVCRIIAHNEKGSWGFINDVKMYSILDIGTPHGTVIVSGCMYINEITPEGLIKLEAYESELREKSEPLYNGKLDTILTK